MSKVKISLAYPSLVILLFSHVHASADVFMDLTDTSSAYEKLKFSWQALLGC